MQLSGKELSSAIRTDLALKCQSFIAKTGRTPALAVILAGDNPASLTYVSAKKKACDEAGMICRDITLPGSVSQKELLGRIAELNTDPSVDGILVQLPLPEGLDEQLITRSIDPAKDVDGFCPENIGRLLLGEKTFVPCTPKGIMRLLDEYGIPTWSADVCIVGRSNIVGKPLAALFMQRGRDATVTVCNSRTKDLAGHVKRADIVIAAVGRPGTITADMVREGATVIDVGINRIPDSSRKSGFRLAGDVDYNAVEPKAGAITPVPGGVGPMTIAMLLENTVEAACMHEGIEFSDL